MIKEKLPHECVTVAGIKLCEDLKKMVLEKQRELKNEGLNYGKKVAIKELLYDLKNMKDEDYESRSLI